MEQAIYITSLRSLEKHFKKKYTRVYFGAEFCERLIQPEAELSRVMEYAKREKAAFTYVTPYVSNKGVETLKKRLSFLKEKAPETEIVVNDWGIFHVITRDFAGFPLLLGRLMSKQKRGPRIMNVLDKVPEAMIDHFRRGTTDVPVFMEFVRKKGVVRLEYDNLLQGIERNNPLPGSLYYPYAYVSTTRKCLVNSCDVERPSMQAIFPCKFECRKYSFTLTHKEMPVPLELYGNTQFFKNDKLPGNLDKLKFDRLVFEPEIPL